MEGTKMSGAFNNYGQDEATVNDDAVCECGHKLYLHDDGKDDCVVCDCQCQMFETTAK